MFACLPLAILLASATPPAAAAEPAAVAPPPLEVRPWSTDLVDPAGMSRFHLITRAAFGDGRSANSGASAWSYEARAHVRLTEGVALSAVLPLGLVAGRGAEGAAFFLGNIGAGVTVGGNLTEADKQPRFRLAGGFDVYAPTSSDDPINQDILSTVASVRSYETQLYISKALSFRLRGMGELQLDMLTLSLEVGFIPVVSLAKDADGFALLFGGIGRVSAAVTPFFEPYLEVGGATQMAGAGEVKPPLLITPGLRFHIAEVFDPALFVSINFVQASAVVVGIDLAFVIRPSREKKRANVDLFEDRESREEGWRR